MKKPTFLAILLLIAAQIVQGQTAQFKVVEHEGPGFLKSPIFHENNYYVIRPGKNSSITKLNSSFEITKEATFKEEDLKPNGKKLIFEHSVVINSDLYLGYFDATEPLKYGFVLFRLGKDLTLTDPTTIFTYTYKSGGEQLKNMFSLSDALVVSEDKSKIAYVRQGNGGAKTIAVVVCDNNLNILWQKEYEKISGDKEKLKLATVQVSNDGQSVIALYDREISKGIIYTKSEQQEFQPEADGIEVIACRLQTKNDKTFLAGIYGRPGEKIHKVNGFLYAPLNLSSGKVDKIKRLELDEDIVNRLNPDNLKQTEKLLYNFDLVAQTADQGYFINIRRKEEIIRQDGIVQETTQILLVKTDPLFETKYLEKVYDFKDKQGNYRDLYGSTYLLGNKLVLMPMRDYSPMGLFPNLSIIDAENGIKTQALPEKLRDISLSTSQFFDGGQVDGNSVVLYYATGAKYGQVRITVPD